MTDLLIIIFWTGAGILVYTYAGYPAILYILNKIPFPPPETGRVFIDEWPDVSLVVAAYNEERVIGGKIENSLKLDYPGNLDVWIASDGSTDGTDEIVRSFSLKNKRVHLLPLPRTGKSGAINSAMRFIKSDIVVFSDANTEFKPDVLKNLVRHFADPGTGCVCGRLIYRNPGRVISGEGESFYWKYETSLKKMENKFGYIAGANGAIYAIRRGLFEPLRPKTINDDFIISMRIVKKGFKSIYEENAIAFEDVAPDAGSEFRRHVRDGAGHYIAIFHLYGLLNPLLGTRAFIYWSHRVLRWSVPFVLFTTLAANIALINNPFYRAVLAPHFLFYLLALAGLLGVKLKKLPFFVCVPFYFLNLNAALFVGFLKALTDSQKPSWERTERIGRSDA